MLTFSTRILTAVLSVVNVLIGTNYLGVEGYGTVSLIILGITIYLMIQNIVTGNSLVYHASKFNTSSLLIWSYLWLIVSVIMFILLVKFVEYLNHWFNWGFELVPAEYLFYVVILATSYGMMNIHLYVILGKERIRSYNAVFFIQHVALTASLLIMFPLRQNISIQNYLLAILISYSTGFLFAFLLSLSELKKIEGVKFLEFKALLRYGILGQTANIFQLLNYRLSYYLIDVFVGRAGLGLFSAATQICEGLWIFGKSIGTVLFVRISNSSDLDYARNLALRLMKFTIFITATPLILLMFLPSSFYQFLLGNSFGETPEIIQLLATGTVALSASVSLSSYFSGSGRISINTVASGLGVIVTLILGFSVIPLLETKGAAIVSSISYLTSFIYLIIVFRKERKLGFRDMILTRSDLQESWSLLTSRLRKR